MKSIQIMIWLAVFLSFLLVGTSFSQSPSDSASVLKENMKFLEKIVNKKWVGKTQAPDGCTLEIVREFNVVWDGNAIKRTEYCRAVNYEGEGFIYWDSGEKAIKYFSISNRGIFVNGTVSDESGKILIAGKTTFADKALDFKNIFELTDDGKLLDRFFSFENGQWKAGHDLVLTAEE